MEGGEEEPSTLGTVWYYAWEYGLEVVPVAAPTRGFVRAYNEGSTLGMGLSAIELGSDLSGIGPLMRGGKLAVKGTVKGIGKVASEVKPLASAAIDVAKTKAGQAYSFAKSKAGDAATWMSETSDSVVGGLAGTANWMYSGAAGFFGRGKRLASKSFANTKEFQFADRTWFDDIDSYRALKAEIARDGLKDKLIEYVEIAGQRYVVRGNGRLQIAEDLGLTEQLLFKKVELPFMGYRTEADVIEEAMNIIYNLARGIQ